MHTLCQLRDIHTAALGMFRPVPDQHAQRKKLHLGQRAEISHLSMSKPVQGFEQLNVQMGLFQ